MSSQNIDFENFDMSQLNPNYVPLEQEQQEQQEQEPAAVALADADGLTWFVPPVVADAVVNNNKQQLPCTVCHKAYVCKKFLQRHKTFHHHLCKQVQQLDCDHCGAIFADVDSHMKHLEETDSHLKEYFSVGLPQKIKQQQRAATLSCSGDQHKAAAESSIGEKQQKSAAAISSSIEQQRTATA